MTHQAPYVALVSLGSVLWLAACDSGGSAPADLVLRGGAVLTMDAERPEARAIAVADGRIVWIGDDAEAQGWIGDNTEVQEIGGGLLLPGFQDAHIHPVSGGAELGECDLNAMADAKSVLAKIAECADADPGSIWLRGGGFQLPHFTGGSPTAAMLDAIESTRPVWLTSADGHSAWVNTAALEVAGVTALTQDPPLGRIERDPRTGAPTGTLREAAMDLVGRHVPKRSPEQLTEGLRRALALASSFGITALQEASAGRDELEAYAALRDSNELTARVSISLWVDPRRGLEQVADLAALQGEFDADGLRVETVKLFADGVIEGQTAALLEPYSGRGNFRGELNFEPEALTALVTALDAEGFQVHVHAIGDRAIRVTLDAFEEARRLNGARDARHHIAHAQLIDPADVPRFQELGVAVNFQPLWAWADSYITDLTEPVLGPARSRWLYPIHSMAAAGSRVVFGSDWSVSTMNPLPGIEVAVTRSDPESSAQQPWIPEERIDLATALAAYTSGSAWVNFLDHETGSIEVGKAADLVLLERDLRRVPPTEIGDVEVVRTILAGQTVFSAPKTQRVRAE